MHDAPVPTANFCRMQGEGLRDTEQSALYSGAV
jgi:hypothetical protein